MACLPETFRLVAEANELQKNRLSSSGVNNKRDVCINTQSEQDKNPIRRAKTGSGPSVLEYSFCPSAAEVEYF
jgi:hypothetical protein